MTICSYFISSLSVIVVLSVAESSVTNVEGEYCNLFKLGDEWDQALDDCSCVCSKHPKTGINGVNCTNDLSYEEIVPVYFEFNLSEELGKTQMSVSNGEFTTLYTKHDDDDEKATMELKKLLDDLNNDPLKIVYEMGTLDIVYSIMPYEWGIVKFSDVTVSNPTGFKVENVQLRLNGPINEDPFTLDLKILFSAVTIDFDYEGFDYNVFQCVLHHGIGNLTMEELHLDLVLRTLPVTISGEKHFKVSAYDVAVVISRVEAKPPLEKNMFSLPEDAMNKESLEKFLNAVTVRSLDDFLQFLSSHKALLDIIL